MVKIFTATKIMIFRGVFKMKTARFYTNIIRETRLAVCLKIKPTDKRGVWFPKSLISLDDLNKTVTVSNDIWYQKQNSQ